jgi:hypothetical protein
MGRADSLFVFAFAYVLARRHFFQRTTSHNMASIVYRVVLTRIGSHTASMAGAGVRVMRATPPPPRIKLGLGSTTGCVMGRTLTAAAGVVCCGGVNNGTMRRARVTWVDRDCVTGGVRGASVAAAAYGGDQEERGGPSRGRGGGGGSRGYASAGRGSGRGGGGGRGVGRGRGGRGRGRSSYDSRKPERAPSTPPPQQWGWGDDASAGPGDDAAAPAEAVPIAPISAPPERAEWGASVAEAAGHAPTWVKEAPQAPPPPPPQQQQQQQPPQDGIEGEEVQRVAKLMAWRGVCSRREAEAGLYKLRIQLTHSA